MNTSPGYGNGNAEALPTLLASDGRSTLLQSETSKPPRPFTKDEINAALIRPDGFRASDDFDDLSYDLSNLILPMVVGQSLNKGDLDLDKLVDKHGVRFCHFWAHWLPRKIADEYAKNRPVLSPTGLYRSAVEQGWTVNPKWAAFDEKRHTFAAREQYINRQLERNLKSSHAKFTQVEVTKLADEVRKSQRQLAELPEHIRVSVRDEIARLQEIDEMDAFVDNDKHRANVGSEDPSEFGSSEHTAPSSNDDDELEDELPF